MRGYGRIARCSYWLSRVDSRLIRDGIPQALDWLPDDQMTFSNHPIHKFRIYIETYHGDDQSRSTFKLETGTTVTDYL